MRRSVTTSYSCIVILLYRDRYGVMGWAADYSRGDLGLNESRGRWEGKYTLNDGIDYTELITCPLEAIVRCAVHSFMPQAALFNIRYQEPGSSISFLSELSLAKTQKHKNTLSYHIEQSPPNHAGARAKP